MRSIGDLHHPAGTLFDDRVSRKFLWGFRDIWLANHIHPYTRPWVGVVHEPPGVPAWHGPARLSPEMMLSSDRLAHSLPHCKGLFTLSEHLRDWIADRVPVPVEAVPHPTETPTCYFTPQQYLDNRERRIIQIGRALQRMHSLYLLPTTTLCKTLLRATDRRADALWEAELGLLPDGGQRLLGTVEAREFVDGPSYDALLMRNIVFLDMYACSASDTLLGCLVRGTPVVVNRLPAVTEYLGADYPLYFDDLTEAARKAEDDQLVVSAHEHLMDNPVRRRLTGEHFRARILESSIYRGLDEV